METRGAGRRRESETEGGDSTGESVQGDAGERKGRDGAGTRGRDTGFGGQMEAAWEGRRGWKVSALKKGEATTEEVRPSCGWGGASSGWSCHPGVGGPTGAPLKTECANRGTPPHQISTPRGPPGSPRGRRGGGPSGSPAPRRGEEGGRRRRREGGDATCPVSPQAPRAIPAPRAREGKGREDEAAGRWGFPGLPERNWESGVQALPVQPCGVLLPPPSGRAGSTLRAWHPRGAPSPRPSRFSHPDLAESHPPTSPPRARVLTQPTSSPPAAWGARCSRHGAIYVSLHPLPAPLSPACLPLSKPLPTAQVSWGLARLTSLCQILGAPGAHPGGLRCAPAGTSPHPTTSGPLLPRTQQPPRRVSVGPPQPRVFPAPAASGAALHFPGTSGLRFT